MKNIHKKTIYITTFFLSIILNSFKVNADTYTESNYEYEMITNEFTTNDIINLIYHSDNLDVKEKYILINKSLFDDILPYISRNNCLNSLKLRLSNINIKTYDEIDFSVNDEILENAAGFYAPIDSSTIYVNSNNSNVLTHEFIHMLQFNYKYPYISESVCELYNIEYYNSTYKSYGESIKRIKVLMEIIGSEPIKEYIYSQESDMIDEILSTYLCPESCDKIKTIFSSSPNAYPNIHDDLDVLLIELHKNIYGYNIYNNILIYGVYNESSEDRKYFNTDSSIFDSLKVKSLSMDYIK